MFSKPLLSYLPSFGQSSSATATSNRQQAQPQQVQQAQPSSQQQPQQPQQGARTDRSRTGNSTMKRLLDTMARRGRTRGAAADARGAAAATAAPGQGAATDSDAAPQERRRSTQRSRPSLKNAGWTPDIHSSVTGLVPLHASATLAKHPEGFDDILRAWDEERNAVFDAGAAQAIRARLQNNAATTAQCVTEWAALPPVLQLPQADSGLSFHERLLRLVKIPENKALSMPTAVVAAILGEIDRTIGRDSWEPELDAAIAQCPSLQETAARIKPALDRINTAIKRFDHAHTNQMRNRARDRAHGDLAAACTEAAAVCGDYEKALGLARKAVLGTIGSSGLSTAQTIAQSVLPWGPGVLAMMAMELARDSVSAADTRRASFITNELNLRYANLEGGVRRLWKGPIQGRLELLATVLEHEAEYATPARQAELRTDLKLVREGRLDALPTTSRAATLLSRPNEFRNAAIKVCLSRQFLSRLGESFGRELMDKTIGALTDQISDATEALAASAGADFAENVIDDAETAGASGSGLQQLSAGEARAPTPPLVLFVRELHGALAAPLGPLTEEPASMLPAEVETAASNAAPGAAPRATRSAPTSAAAFARKGKAAMNDLAVGITKMASRVKESTKVISAGGLSARAYLDLYAQYQEGLQRLDTGAAAGGASGTHQ